MTEARNFVCPITEAACADPRCRKDDFCTQQQGSLSHYVQVKPRDLERRRRNGLPTLSSHEDLLRSPGDLLRRQIYGGR